MTAYHDYKKITVTIASGATLSSEFDISHNYDHVYVLIPSGCTWDTQVYMAAGSGETYYPAAPLGGTTNAYASSISGKYCQITNHGRFNKLRATTAPADGTSYTVVCFT